MEKTTWTALEKGLHPLQINYLASPNAPALYLEWHGQGADMRAISTNQFYINERALQ